MNSTTIKAPLDLAILYGLDEAVLYQALFNIGEATNGGWLKCTPEKLKSALPFWNEEDFDKRLGSLELQGAIYLDCPRYSKCAELIYSNKLLPKAGKHNKNFQEEQNELVAWLNEDWEPSIEAIKYLEVSNCHLTKDALDDIKSSYLLEISSGKVAKRASNSEFLNFAAKYVSRAVRARDKSSSEINRNWKPSTAVISRLQSMDFKISEIKHLAIRFRDKQLEAKSRNPSWSTAFYHYAVAKRDSLKALTHIQDWIADPIAQEILNDAGVPEWFQRIVKQEFVYYWSNTEEVNFDWDSLFVKNAKQLWRSHQMKKKDRKAA